MQTASTLGIRNATFQGPPGAVSSLLGAFWKPWAMLFPLIAVQASPGTEPQSQAFHNQKSLTSAYFEIA